MVKFVGAIAENYKNLADSIKEKYSGDEYERQMGILNKAFSEASDLISDRYSKQMRILSGDIVINRSVLTKGFFDWDSLQNADTSVLNYNDLQKMDAFLRFSSPIM